MCASGSSTLSFSDNISVADTASSSGMTDVHVALFCNNGILEKMCDVEKILMDAFHLKCCVSERDFPAGRLAASNVHSAARHCELRVFVITKKYLDHSLKHHESLLANNEISTQENTLLLTAGRQKRNIPPYMKHFHIEEFPSGLSPSKVATSIHSFYQNMKKETVEEPDLRETSDDDSQENVTLTEEGKSNSSNREPVDLSNYETKLQKLSLLFGKFDQKRGYLLVTSPISDKFHGLENIARIPWLRVFDFDPKSRVCGLLSVAEEVLKQTRYHTKTDLLDDIETPDDKTTNWVFINGYTDSAETLHQENRPVDAPAVYKHSISIAEHCQGKKVPTILIMWYAKYSNMDLNLDHLLSGIRFALQGVLGKFSCVTCVDKIPDKHSDLYKMLYRLDLLDSTVVIPLEVLCCFFETFLRHDDKRHNAGKTLPKYPDVGEDPVSVDIEEGDFQWISVCFDLLAMTPPCEAGNENRENADVDTGIAFLKGAEITWDVIENGTYDARRDMLMKAKNYTMKHITAGKSGVITIFHSPGGGGTTFARRLLWDLRTIVPCAELTSSQVNVEELKERLSHIRELTKQPTVILVDGKSDNEIKKLMDISRSMLVIVVHVQRYYSNMSRAKRSEDRFFLPDRVSPTEADSFCSVFTMAAKESESKLTKITRKIKNNEDHLLFEYGLTAFQSEFRGVRRYVHGHLQINPDEELQDWHTVLAYLSMANYYGHRGLPSKLFSKILKKDDDEIIELDDLPHSARQFITEEKGIWKITYYIVSREILEQILVKRSTIDYTSDRNKLSPEAKKLLCDWALEFIENVKRHSINARRVPANVSDILTSIFIRRYYNDPGEKEIENKSNYSRIMEDTGSEEDQCKILTKLVTCFPFDAEFLAHLGRFYYKRRQPKFDEAENLLSRAVETRRNKLGGMSTKPDDVLERIHNMFGFCYNSHVRHAIGATLGNLHEDTLAGKSLPSLIRLCLEKAGKAIENFENGRKWHQKGSNPTFAYLGEIKVRLHLTELAKVISKGNVSDLQDMSSPYTELGLFVMKSFSECDYLLTQCIYCSSEKDIPEDELNLCLNKFQFFFQNASKALESWAGTDTSVQSKRCHVTVLKMHLKQMQQGQRFRVYDIKKTQQVNKLVELYEGIFDGVYKNQHLKVRISAYMMDWLQAIRHKDMPRDYSQADVLTRTKKWAERKETGSLAKFYQYILTTLISFSSPPGELSNLYSAESAAIKDQMEIHMIPLHLLDVAIEWLGRTSNSQSFRNLINLTALGERNGKFWSDSATLSRLQVCKGTIHSCKIHNGWIILEGGQKPPIQVFFVPRKYNIGAAHSKQRTRVEFYLGFTPRHRAEAYEVTVLKTFPCPACRTPTEVPMLGKDISECFSECRMCESVVRPDCT